MLKNYGQLLSPMNKTHLPAAHQRAEQVVSVDGNRRGEITVLLHVPLEQSTEEQDRRGPRRVVHSRLVQVIKVLPEVVILKL